jgi:hypothetical protein
VNDAIRGILTEYDALGRVEKVSSYSASDCSGTPLNRVNSRYNDFGALDRE